MALAKKYVKTKKQITKNNFPADKPPKEIKTDLYLNLQCNSVQAENRAIWGDPECGITIQKNTPIDFVKGLNNNSCLVSVEVGALKLNIALPYDMLK
jgi:hypothetical protein